MQKKGLFISLILLMLMSFSSLGGNITGWPRMDRTGLPLGWNASSKKRWSTFPRAIGDVNNNGKKDIVVPKGHGVAIFEKNADGKWIEIAVLTNPAGNASVSNYGDSIAIGDTDGDGKPEILFGTGQGKDNANASRVYIFEHTEGNNFAKVATLGPFNKVASSSVNYVRIADANMDGKTEIIITHAYKKNHYIRIYQASADNSWHELFKHNITKDKKFFHCPTDVAVADLNNNGKPELYVGVKLYDKSTGKTHGWLYVYEMTESNNYKIIWKSDDVRSYAENIRLLTDKNNGKTLIAAKLGRKGKTWAIFEHTAKGSYQGIGRKSWSKIKNDYIIGLFTPLSAQTKIGIYNAGRVLGAKGIFEALKQVANFKVHYINSFNEKTLIKYDIIILPAIHAIGKEKPGWRQSIRSYVASGGGIILCHDVVGYRKLWTTPLFPEIEKGISKINSYTLMLKDPAHPICKGLPATFKHAYFDHINMAVTDKGKSIITDKQGNNVVVVGKYGRGRLVAMGNICGWSDKNKEQPPVDGELKLLINSVNWLATNRQKIDLNELKIQLKKSRFDAQLKDAKRTVLEQLTLAEWELETKFDFMGFDLDDLSGKLAGKEYSNYKQQLIKLKADIFRKSKRLRKQQQKNFDSYIKQVKNAENETELKNIKKNIGHLFIVQNMRKWIKAYPLTTRHKKYLPEIKHFVESSLLSLQPLSQKLARLKKQLVKPVIKTKNNEQWLKNRFITVVINHYGNFIPGLKETLRYLGRYGVAQYNAASIHRFKKFYTYFGYKTQDEYIKDVLSLCDQYNLKFFGQPGRACQGIPGIKKYRRINIAQPAMLKRQQKIVKYIIDQCGNYPAFGGIHWDEPEFDILSLLPDKSSYSGSNFGDGEYLKKLFINYLKDKYKQSELLKLGLQNLANIKIPTAKERKDNMVLWVEYQEFIAQCYLDYYKNLFAYAHKLKPDFIADILLTPMHYSAFLAVPQSAVYKMGADLIMTDIYWTGSPSTAFALDLLRSGTDVPIVQTVGVFYGGTVETYRRDLAMTYAHAQGCYVFDWCGYFKQRPYWNTGGRSIDSSHKMWQATTEFLEKIKKIEPYLVKTKSPTQIALLFSERTAAIDYYKPGYIGGDYTSNQIGIYRALAQNHIQCEPIHATGLTQKQLDKYNVLIVSNAKSLTVPQMTLVKNWVKQGGYIITTGSSYLCDRWGRTQSDYQLKELLGVSFVKTSSWDTIAGLDFKNNRIECKSGKYDKIKVTTGKIIGTWKDGTPAVVVNKYGKGKSIFFSYHFPGLSFSGSGNKAGRFEGSVTNMNFSKGIKGMLANWVNTGLKHSGSQPLFNTKNCPATVEVYMRNQAAGRRKIIHFINHSLANKQVSNIQITLPYVVRKAFYGVDHKPLKKSVKDGMTTLYLRSFEIYEMAVIEK